MTRAASSSFTQPIQAPYPGLRPFQPHEWPIFFGRNEHVADMLTILENHRFLAVVGPSGGGKSSLVLAGLIPALDRGELLTAQSDDWRFVILRPGDAPYSNLADSAQRHLPNGGPQTFHDGDVGLTELVLRGSPFGFVEALHDAAVPEQTNVLLLVDQFEELFRFRTQESASGASGVARRDDAAAFVQLLLETAKQTRRSVYVMLTMRTDFLGECDVFDGLPQAINQSQYLTPRLNLTQLAEVIVRPLEQPPFRGSVAPEVVQRILNDIGTGRDELPIVQHVLFRAWQRAKDRNPGEGAQLTLADYDKVGGLKNALSLHADEALNDCKARGQERVVEKVFCALCTRGANGQYIRRPATIQQLADESGFSLDEVISVVESFRGDDRSFLMPPKNRELAPATKIDVSHESLLRQWTTLSGWVEQESRSAATFIRLRDGALRWPVQESFLRDPALSNALTWKEQQQPSPAWAERYGGGLSHALEYLKKSQEERDGEVRAADALRRRELEDAQARAAEQSANARRFRIATIVMATLLVAAAVTGLYAWKQKQKFVSANLSLKQLDDAKIRLQQYNEALAGIGAAYGTVKGSSTEEVAITFHESEVSPDTVLPFLDRVGKVQSLNLSRTKISDAGLKDIARLTSLKSLDLSFTEITDAGIAHLAEMAQLSHLLLNDTMLTEAGLARLEKLVNLKTLDLSRNQVNQASVDKVRSKLSGCSITYNPDPLLDAISKYGGDWDAALTLVQGRREAGGFLFSSSPITDAALRKIAKTENPETLILSYCDDITNEGLKYLLEMRNLTSVTLQWCSQISDPGIENMSGMSKLKSLTLEYLALTDRGLKGVSQASALTKLVILGSTHRITDDGVAYLARLAGLEQLAINHTNTLKGDPLVHIAKLEKLRSLSFVDNNNVPSSTYAALSALPMLRKLEIGYNNKLADADLIHLEKLTQVETLDLTDCARLTQTGVAKLKKALPNATIEWTVSEAAKAFLND